MAKINHSNKNKLNFLYGLATGIVIAAFGIFAYLRLNASEKFPPTNGPKQVRCISECSEAASACDDKCNNDQGCMDRCTDEWNRCINRCRSTL